MSGIIDETPLTERYFETTLWRLLGRIAPLVDLSRHGPPTAEQALLIQAVSAENAPLSVLERTWAGFTITGQFLSQSTLELTEPELLLIAITKLRQLLLTGEPDSGAVTHGDTFMGQVFMSVLTVGVLAAGVFGDDAGDVLNLREIAENAQRAKAGRAANALRVAAARTEWHGPALSRAQELRAKYPHRSDEAIGGLVHDEGRCNTPSHAQTVAAVRLWRRDGKLPPRLKAKA